MAFDRADYQQGVRYLGHSDLAGEGDGMQIMMKDTFLYVGRPTPGRNMLVIDISDPRNPREVAKIPNYPDTRMSKCQVFDDYLLVNYEQRYEIHPEGRKGWGVFDISNPAEPRELAYVHQGGRGTHRLWWAGERHCYVAGRPEGFRERMIEIYDMGVPESPELVGRWWTEGLWADGGETPPERRPNGPLLIHHGIYEDGLLYCGYWGGGILVLDVSDPTSPSVVTQLEWEPGDSQSTHTVQPLPGRGLLAVFDEAQEAKPTDPPYRHHPTWLRVVEASDVTNLKEVGRWRPDEDIFADRPGRFGPHNLHEHRPGVFHSEDLLFGAFFNAGLQVIDIKDPTRPRSIAHYVPEPGPDDDGVPQATGTNDVLVSADGLIFIADRNTGGLHVLELE